MEFYKTNFPDKNFLRKLADHLKKKVENYQKEKPLDRIVLYSGAAMQWLGDFMTDTDTDWEKAENFEIDELTLTGTNPEWNEIIVKKCGCSPKRFRELIKNNSDILEVFKGVSNDGTPILVRRDGAKRTAFKVLDGMKRVMAALINGDRFISAYVAQLGDNPKPMCEPHVVYDLIRAYQRGINNDRKGLIIALRYLRKSYSNVDNLLRERFGKQWISDKEIQSVIKESLKDG